MIPKIIHQTGPVSEKWHPIWKECRENWKNKFPDFEYKILDG
jgi:mannosyltransferase OCH1-like enzyme